MPVILPEHHHAAWLGETEDGNLKELLVPYPADQMRMWVISHRVNSPKNDDPQLWEPVHAEPPQTTTDTLETCLYVADLHRAAEWYRQLFGFPIIFQQEDRLRALQVANDQVLLLFRLYEFLPSQGRPR
jgi:hypothetical protein